jgi:sugar phosphate isomerase/epimerase
MASRIAIGLNARLFPVNWRPARQEIAFAADHGFTSLQFNGQEQGIDADYLGDEVDQVADALQAASIIPVMEIVVRLLADGHTKTGLTPLDVLRANMPAMTALGCACVHWHLAPAVRMSESELHNLERMLLPQLEEAISITRPHGVRFGLEHNEPEIPLFANPMACATALAAVPGLSLVWDLNHTPPHQLNGFLDLAGSFSMLHVSDTPLPEVNHHLPLGLGSVDFVHAFHVLIAAGFAGPAILEIGGLPKSGGYGRDTDQALCDSLAFLQDVLRGSNP